MAQIQFNQNSILSAGNQTYALSTLISIPQGLTPPPVLAIRVYDRDVYAGTQSYDYGHFTSPNGGRISAGNQLNPTTLYFDFKNGQYVSRDTGDALGSFNFTTSDQNYRSVYLSLFTNNAENAIYQGNWLDTHWNHLSDLNVVTRTNYVDATPNVATPEEIAAIAKSFIGTVWNDHGCWLLTSNISAAAGASLPIATAAVNSNITGNEQWRLVFNGAHQTDDWRALLKPGDIIQLQYLKGEAHIATVTSGYGHNALWVDNSGVSANDGSPGDIIIQGEHSVEDWTHSVRETSVVVLRLADADVGATAALPATIAPPVVTPYSQSIQVGHSLSLASLFSVQDPNLLPMTSYQIVDHKGPGNIALNGAVNLASPAQQQAGVVIVSASDLAKLTIVAGLGQDALTITAFDGQAWGSANVTLTGWTDPPPTVTGASVAVHADSQLLPVSSLFTASAAGAHTITQYRLVDADHRGQLIVPDSVANLASNEERALGVYRVSASDLEKISWKVLPDTGTISVSAFDGVQWSDYAAVTVAGQNAAPVVEALPRMALSVGEPVSVASMFTMSDADRDAVKYVTIYDYFDRVQLNGAVDLCPLAHSYEVSIADLPKLTLTAPAIEGGLQAITVYASDGTSWGRPTAVYFTTEDPHPIVEATTATQLSPDQTVSLRQLFRAVDPNDKSIMLYQVQDPVGGGTVLLGDAKDLATDSQKLLGIKVFAASDLDKVTYVAGHQVGSETLGISAYNGSLWGSANVAVSGTDNTSPTIMASPATVDVGQTVRLKDLYSAYTPSGKPITQYLIRDPDGGGSVLLNGAKNLAASTQQGMLIAAADIGKLQYLGAAADGHETIGISAFDGTHWGQADLLVTSKNFGRPVVTALPLTVHAGQSISLQDLFRVSDANGSAIQGYQVNDTAHHLQLNGTVNYYADEQYKGVYGIYAKDIGKVVYVAGGPGTETIYVEAGNAAGGTSLPEALTITVLPNPVLTPTTVTVAMHQTVALSNFFTSTNPSGKELVQYKIVDPSGAGAVHLNGAANLATAGEQAQGIAIVAAADLDKLSYTGAASFAVDKLTISAFDGDSWGSADVAVTTIDGAAPQITALTSSVETDATVALATLFSATSHSAAPITQYKIIDPSGGGKLVLNGAANSASAAQQAQQGMAIISAADLSMIQYVGADAPGSETLIVSAFDGQSWGTSELAITTVKTAPPVVTPATAYLEPGESVSITSLFGVNGADGHKIDNVAYYILQDTNNHIQLNGATNLWAAQESAGYYWISAADIAQVTYVPSRDGVFNLSAIVNDGFQYSSWAVEKIVAGQERLSLPPAITPSSTVVPLEQKVLLSSIFSFQDPVGNAIAQFSVLDPAGGGSIVLNGATDLASPSQQALGLRIFAADDLARVQYQGSATAGAEALTISVYDGMAWGTADIAVTSAVLPPYISAATTSVEFNHTIKVSDLFRISTTSGAPLSQYKFQDPAGGGAILLNGAMNLADAQQQTQGISIFSAADLAKVQYTAGSAAGSETLLIGASDGQSWGAANIAVATTDSRPPVIGQLASNVDVAATVRFTSLVEASSVSGKKIIEYLIADPAGGGTLDLNGAQDLASAAQKSQGIVAVAAYDLHSLIYTGGAKPGSETLTVTAFDGENSSTSDIMINTVAAMPPVVLPKPVTLHVGEAVFLSDLFAISDPNGHAITWYLVHDNDLGINLNGAANLAASPLYDYHGLYDFNNATDWNKVQYVAHDPGTVRISLQVVDGFNTSAYVEEVITIIENRGSAGAGANFMNHAQLIGSIQDSTQATPFNI